MLEELARSPEPLKGERRVIRSFVERDLRFGMKGREKMIRCFRRTRSEGAELRQ
jgi:hypothetical protein